MSKFCRLRIILCLLSILTLATSSNPPDHCINPPQDATIIKDQSNSTYGDLAIDVPKNIVILQNVSYGCEPGSNAGDCSVSISAETICFMDNVNLLYPLIVLNASAIYINNSTVNASGTRLGGEGTNLFDTEIGYSYAGFGGFGYSCDPNFELQPSYAYSKNFSTYGDYDDLWNVTDTFRIYGTGHATEVGFAGGGKIIIQAVDSLQILISHIESTGVANCSEKLVTRARAGTGGYIFVSMLNDSGVLNLTSSFFNVSGGPACNDSDSLPGLAGSGGRLVFDLQADLESLQISADGGYTSPTSSACQVAGAGTAYNTRIKTLLIKRSPDSSFSGPTLAMTVIKNVTNLQTLKASGFVWLTSASDLRSEVICDTLELSNGARLTPTFNKSYGNHFEMTVFGEITVKNYSVLQFLPTTVANIDCYVLTLQDDSRIRGPRIYITTLLNDTRHRIDIQNSLIDSTQNTLMPTAIFLYSYQISLSDATLSANYVHMLAKTATQAGKSLIRALQISCKGDLKASIHNPILGSYKLFNSTNSQFNLNQVMSTLLNRTLPNTPLPQDFFEFAGRLSSDYTLILMAISNVDLHGSSQISGARIGMFGQNITISQGSKVSSDGNGCKGGAGFSSGLKDDQFASSCGGSGGSHGGTGGIGLSSESSKDSNCQKMKTYPYGNPSNPILEGSGGSNTKTCTGGSGGGVVIVGAYDLKIDGTVSSNGKEGALSAPDSEFANDCGGGSGGSIQIHSLSRFTGNGSIIAKGGNSIDNGGAGGAGRILLNYYGWFRKENATTVFRGNITAAIGDRVDGSSVYLETPSYYQGTVYSNPCMPGYYGLYCQPCPVGTYKDDFTNDECKNCTNSPEKSKPNTTNGWNGTSYLCPYICDDMTVQEGSRTLCLNYFQYYTRYVGGLPGVSILVFFCIIVVGLILHKNSNKRSRKAQRLQSMQRSTLQKSIPEKKDHDQTKKSSSKPDFVMEDLPIHTARVYLKGCNHTTQSWYLSDEPPSSLRDKIDESKYGDFIKEINQLCVWTNTEIILISVSEIIYYPIYAWLLTHKKQKILRRVQNFLGASKKDIWKDMRARELSYTIKLSSSPDYSLAYLDFLDEDHSVLEWENTTQFPISIILSGEGNFLSPYQINTSDPLVKSVSFCLKQLVGFEGKDDFELEGKRHSQEEQNIKRMELFLLTFNTLMREIDHAAPKAYFLDSMHKLLKYLRTANIKFFNNSKIESELRVYFCPRDKKDGPVASYGLHLLDDGLDELLSSFHKTKKNLSEYDVQISINFSRGEDISLSKHTGPQLDEQDEEEEKSEINEDPFSEDYNDLNYDGFPNRKHSRLDLLDPETQELLELKQKLLKKIETRRKNIQAIMINTEITQLHLPTESAYEKWPKLRKTIRWVEFIRYFLISFRPKKFDKYFMTIVMSILVVLDLSYAIYRLVLLENLQYFLLLPYPLSTISPFIGLISLLFTSQNKLGRLFLMLNAMSIANMILLIFFSSPKLFPIFDAIAKGLICAFGSHYISYLEHLKCLNDLDRFLE